MIDNSHKVAWVFGYLKAYFDLYVSMGTNPKDLSISLNFLTERILDRLGIEDQALIIKTIEQLDTLDIEVTIAKVIKENTRPDTKSFRIML